MNKKFLKAIAALAMAASVGAGVAAISACGGATYEGDYHYANAWSPTSPDYGIKVEVAVSGSKIKSVKIVDSDYVSVTDSWESKATWNDNIDELLKAYRGLEVADVLAETVRVAKPGTASQPNTVENENLMITGATQGSGRLLLAVQNALLEAAKDLGYEVKTGEYHYNSWGHEYGIKVRVVVKDGKILSVGIIDSDYVELTDSWTEEGKAKWNNGIAGLLAAYKGKTVDAIKAVTVGKEGDVPNSVSDSTLMISGATQGSGRLLLAVQNALSK